MTIDVPILLTPRLRLRGHREDDLADCAAMWGDPEITRHIGGRPFAEEEVWQRILRYVGHWALKGFGYWVIEDLVTGRFVGEAGLSDGRRRLEPSWGSAPEMGWALAGWAHGRGLATEAVAAVLRWAERELSEPRTVCMIEPANAASRRVAHKCGYRPYAQGRYHGTAVELFERG